MNRPERLSDQQRAQALAELERLSETAGQLARWLDDAEPRTAALAHDAASSLITASWALLRGRLSNGYRLRIDAMDDDPQ